MDIGAQDESNSHLSHQFQEEAAMSKITFLNIDLDIESLVDITPIVKEWRKRTAVFRHEEVDGVFYGSFETAYDGGYGVSKIIDEYVSLIEGLSPTSRKIWDQAQKREFDFGYESGSKPNNFHSRIEADYVNKLANLGGIIVITIYPPEESYMA